MNQGCCGADHGDERSVVTQAFARRQRLSGAAPRPRVQPADACGQTARWPAVLPNLGTSLKSAMTPALSSLAGT